jgi:multisubunit Na+/H+ antiporter MnhC subunit
MTLKEVISSSLVIALGLILIIHFTLFWIYGGVFIYESNKIILALETIMSIGIIGFGFERLISIYGKRPGKAKSQEQPAAEQQERRQAAQPLLQGQ